MLLFILLAFLCVIYVGYVVLYDDDIYCPVCGYFCLGKGGRYCIDKPMIVEQQKRSEGK